MKGIERPEMQKENQVSVVITGAKEEGWSRSASFIQQLQVLTFLSEILGPRHVSQFTTFW